MNRWACGVSTSVCFWAAASLALAADRDPAAADALFEQARKEAAAGQYDRACPRFEQSYKLDPTVGTLLNLGDCVERQGRLGAALAHFTEALRELPAGDNRAQFVQDRIAKLKPRVPRLEIVVAAGGPAMKVLRDDVELDAGALNLPLPVEPGRHRIVARAAGRKDRETVVDLSEGESRQVRIEAGDAQASATPTGSTLAATGGTAAPPPPPPPPSSTAPSGRSPWPWVVGGIGVAGLAAGSITGILAMNDATTVRNQCPNRTCPNDAALAAATDPANRGKTLATLSTVGFGVGLVGIAAATVLFLRSPSREASSTTGWIAPFAAPNTAGLAAGGRFE